ncbi:hypothetical protein JVU11DRAFT_2945 [Chiua virens]|nr:hypothetical protein JVU11DRAFT_2945 [Chiua virens]
MTEYDYSPAAYERYMAQQSRVSNWVHDTCSQSHAYSNPFILSPTHRDRSFYDQSDDSPPPHHHSHDQWSMNSSRPSRSRSRSYVDHAHYDRTPQSSRHRTQSHSRTSRDGYPSHGQSYIYAQPHHASRTPAAPRIQTSPPHNYQYPAQSGRSPTREVYVTQPPPGQIYHLSPNPPKDHRHTSHSRHPSSSKPPPQPYLLVPGGGPKAEYKRGPPIHAPVPIKPHGQQQPLLKRLFGFVTMSPVGGRSGNGRAHRGATY